MLNLRQLEVFTAVMRRNSISEAARELGVTQPAVSKILRHTEESLGFPLFERISGGIYPTPEARVLFAEAETICGGLVNLRQLANDLRETRVGHLQIAAVPALGLHLVPEVLAAFKADRPDVRLELAVRPSRDIAELARTQRIDLGVVHFTEENPLVQAEIIGAGRIVCVMPRDHPLANRSELTPSDLRGVPVITYGSENLYGPEVEQAFRAAGARLRPDIVTNSSTAACALADKGLGVAVVDEFSARSVAYGHLAARPLSPIPRISVGILFPRFRPLSRLSREFVQSLKEALGARAATDAA